MVVAPEFTPAGSSTSGGQTCRPAAGLALRPRTAQFYHSGTRGSTTPVRACRPRSPPPRARAPLHPKSGPAARGLRPRVRDDERQAATSEAPFGPPRATLPPPAAAL